MIPKIMMNQIMTMNNVMIERNRAEKVLKLMITRNLINKLFKKNKRN